MADILAGRFRCVFPLPFTAEQGDQVHFKINRSIIDARALVSEEYVELSRRFNVPHDQRYIFQPVDPD